MKKLLFCQLFLISLFGNAFIQAAGHNKVSQNVTPAGDVIYSSKFGANDSLTCTKFKKTGLTECSTRTGTEKRSLVAGSYFNMLEKEYNSQQKRLITKKTTSQGTSYAGAFGDDYMTCTKFTQSGLWECRTGAGASTGPLAEGFFKMLEEGYLNQQKTQQ